ncbi:MAG: DUF721 domain-containing protein [Desulfobacca sp.]|uniref:DUF721 domain-containing protein n=1 Tax=Desulfobacca sp. TaxID=2067990 RepID=UPI00404ABF2D
MAKRPPLSAPAPIQEILAKILKPRDLRQLELHARLRQSWEANVSEIIRQNTRLVDYQKKVLSVETTSHAWLQELHFLKPKILAALQRELGAKHLRDIRFLLQSEIKAEPTDL